MAVRRSLNVTRNEVVEVGTTPVEVLPSNSEATARTIRPLGSPPAGALRVSLGSGRPWEDSQPLDAEGWEERTADQTHDAIYRGSVWMVHNQAGRTFRVRVVESETEITT